MGLGLICPEANGPEAAWADGAQILAPRSLIGLINHFKGHGLLAAPAAASCEGPTLLDALAPAERAALDAAAEWDGPIPGSGTVKVCP